jgi:hypothetical protein
MNAAIFSGRNFRQHPQILLKLLSQRIHRATFFPGQREAIQPFAKPHDFFG